MALLALPVRHEDKLNDSKHKQNLKTRL